MSDAMNQNALLPAEEAKQEISLKEEDMAKAKEIAKTIEIDNSQALIQYGIGAQSKISNFADSILNQVRANDSGYIGEDLTNLLMKIKDVNVNSLTNQKKGVLSNLFFSVDKFFTKYEKLSVQIEKIISQLNEARMQLLRDITMLDQMYGKNLDYLNELDVYIVAGKMKIDEVRSTVLPELQKKVEAESNPATTQELNDLMQFLDRFEKKLHDLKLSRMISIQTAPQLRLIQNNDQLLVEKIQSSIMNTIPLWKNQIVIAVSLFRQKKALEVQREVTDATNNLLEKNSEMLKENSIGTAKEMERGIVEIETLKKVNADLISTIEETLKIQEEGRNKRAAAESELAKMESELKDKLTGIKG
ncbi:MAG: toxic anion resistance protein [Spirochaetaceae bacterium]|nr:toxic anion resistance protein [Spirochaetaceae bacterium]MBP5328883.1 toxic anion resistance protein [Spirochaetaceae bacterium]